MSVRNADCCRHCKNTSTDFHFRDAVLCNKRNIYQVYTNTCDLFEEKKEQ